ncbi:MAG: hypothetical protein ACXWP5_07150 [Bdellovibrionota bacterium]
MGEALMTDAQDWVTLTEFPTLIEAELAKSKLASEGIDCWIPGETVARMQPHLPESRMIAVKVRAGDRAHAVTALGILEPAPAEVPSCPRCGSTRLELARGRFALSLLGRVFVFLLASAFAPMRRRYECQECREKFTRTQ